MDNEQRISKILQWLFKTDLSVGKQAFKSRWYDNIFLHSRHTRDVCDEYSKQNYHPKEILSIAKIIMCGHRPLAKNQILENCS